MYEFKHPTKPFYALADFTWLYEAGGALTISWSVPAGLTLGAQFVENNSIARARIDSGTTGATYLCSCTASNSAGSDTREFRIFVTNQVGVDVVSVEIFEPWVSVAAKGCPTPLIHAAIASAAHEFCKKSGAWRFTAPALPIAAEEASIQLPVPDESTIAGIEVVRMSAGNKLGPITPSDMLNLPVSDPGSPQSYCHDETTLTLYPAPREADTVQCSVFLAPTESATMLPAFLAEKYLKAIAEGAKAELLLIPNEPWTNVDMAAVSRIRFDAAIDQAKVCMITGRAPVQQRVAFRRLGG